MGSSKEAVGRAKGGNEAGEKSRASPDKLSDRMPSATGLQTPATGLDWSYQANRWWAELGASSLRTGASAEGVRGGYEGCGYFAARVRAGAYPSVKIIANGARKRRVVKRSGARTAKSR
jgi:hypothetical protein